MKEFTEKYTQSGVLTGKLLDHYFNSVRELTQLSNINDIKDAEILEIGCGSAFSTERLLEFLPNDANINASDIEIENVEDANRRVGSSVKVIKEDVYSLIREDTSVNLTFVLEVLEHLKNPEKALSEIRRICNGFVILGVPREPIWRILNMVRGKYLRNFGNTPGHLQHWSAHGFKKFLEDNGFVVVAIRLPLPWAIALVKKRN